MSIPDDSCAQCCTCPAPTTQWDSRSAAPSKHGYEEFGSFVSTPPKIYRRATLSGGSIFAIFSMDGEPPSHPLYSCSRDGFNQIDASGPGDGYAEYDLAGAVTNNLSIAGTVTGGSCSGMSVTVNISNTEFSEGLGGHFCSKTGFYTWNDSLSIFEEGDCDETGNAAASGATTLLIPTASGNATATLSIEYTTADLLSYAVASLPAYDDDWNDTAGSFADLSADELSYAIRESRYRHRFPVPKVGSGACYRLAWVERFVPEAGVALDSAEIVTRGVYRPAVTATGGGGTGLVLVAIMASDGTVSAIRILHPGSGYATAPTITVQMASGGGTTSTGWTATVVGGQVTAVTGGLGGDYLPTGAFSGGGGSGATITFTMDSTGGLATSPLGASGSAYTAAPTLAITPKVSDSVAARVDIHLGTETSRCAVWDGVVPGGYDPLTPSTWPILGDGTNPYFELPVPTADGTTLVANVRAYCDCSACP